MIFRFHVVCWTVLFYVCFVALLGEIYPVIKFFVGTVAKTINVTELVKMLLSWPAIALIALFLFWQPVVGILNRRFMVEAAGVVLHGNMGAEQQQAANPPEEGLTDTNVPAAPTVLPEVDDVPVVKEDPLETPTPPPPVATRLRTAPIVQGTATMTEGDDGVVATGNVEAQVPRDPDPPPVEPQPQTLSLEPNDVTPQQLNLLDAIVMTPLLREFMEVARDDLATRLAYSAKANPTADFNYRVLTEILLKHIAFVRLSLVHEENYRAIYGSQIRVLRLLNERTWVHPAAIRPYYDAAAAQYPKEYSTYPYDNYLNFLRVRKLVVYVEDFVQITDLGRALLQWIFENRLTEQKAL